MIHSLCQVDRGWHGSSDNTRENYAFHGGFHGGMHALRQCHAPHKRLKSWVLPDGVVYRIPFEPDQDIGAVLVSFFDPFHRQIRLLESNVDDSNSQWGYV